jgi:hypothetical protein
MALDTEDRKIALRHIADAAFHLTVADRADERGNHALVVSSDAYALDALESVALAMGYRLTPLSLRGALADSVNLLDAKRERETLNIGAA